MFVIVEGTISNKQGSARSRMYQSVEASESKTHRFDAGSGQVIFLNVSKTLDIDNVIREFRKESGRTRSKLVTLLQNTFGQVNALVAPKQRSDYTWEGRGVSSRP